MTPPPTTAVADVLALRGRTGWLSPPLVAFGGRAEPVLGRCVTVQLIPGPPPAGHTGLEPIYELLSGDLSGQVVVMAGAEDVAGAIWGEIFLRAAQSAMAVGAVICGAVRDVGALAAAELPVWGLRALTVGVSGRAHVGAVSGPVRIAGVDICPGDSVVLDADGVVVVGEADAGRVLADAAAYASAEQEVLIRLRTQPLTRAYETKRCLVQQMRVAAWRPSP